MSERPDLEIKAYTGNERTALLAAEKRAEEAEARIAKLETNNRSLFDTWKATERELAEERERAEEAEREAASLRNLARSRRMVAEQEIEKRLAAERRERELREALERIAHSQIADHGRLSAWAAWSGHLQSIALQALGTVAALASTDSGASEGAEQT